MSASHPFSYSGAPFNSVPGVSGLVLLEILCVAVLALLVARFVAQPARGLILNVFKAWVTIRAFWLILAHPVTLDD